MVVDGSYLKRTVPNWNAGMWRVMKNETESETVDRYPAQRGDDAGNDVGNESDSLGV